MGYPALKTHFDKNKYLLALLIMNTVLILNVFALFYFLNKSLIDHVILLDHLAGLGREHCFTMDTILPGRISMEHSPGELPGQLEFQNVECHYQAINTQLCSLPNVGKVEAFSLRVRAGT